MNTIWRQFFLLVVLSFLPVLSQAQICTTAEGITQNGTVTKIPTPSGDLVVDVGFKFNVQRGRCFVRTTPLSPVGISNNEPLTITKNGVTVDFNDAVFNTVSALTCTVSRQSTFIVIESCNGFPRTVSVVIRYTLKGKSTTTDPNIKLFDAKVTAFPTEGSTTDAVTSAAVQVNVPSLTAPTCSFLIDQPNIELNSIVFDKIKNLAAGTTVDSAQKSFNITVNCPLNALSSDASFVPQFSPTKSAVLTGNSHVALDDATDNGAGFKLFDPSGAGIEFNRRLTNFPNSQFSFTPDLRSLTKAFTIKYAKTSNPVTPGPVTSSITITFSLR